jgi:hypothetical protein
MICWLFGASRAIAQAEKSQEAKDPRVVELRHDLLVVDDRAGDQVGKEC